MPEPAVAQERQHVGRSEEQRQRGEPGKQHAHRGRYDLDDVAHDPERLGRGVRGVDRDEPGTLASSARLGGVVARERRQGGVRRAFVRRRGRSGRAKFRGGTGLPGGPLAAGGPGGGSAPGRCSRAAPRDGTASRGAPARGGGAVTAGRRPTGRRSVRRGAAGDGLAALLRLAGRRAALCAGGLLRLPGRRAALCARRRARGLLRLAGRRTAVLLRLTARVATLLRVPGRPLRGLLRLAGCGAALLRQPGRLPACLVSFWRSRNRPREERAQKCHEG
jgi:hypothetical protein